MRIVWFGYGGSRYLAEEIFSREFVADVDNKDDEFICISEWDANIDRPDIKYIKWDKERWLPDLVTADVIILPIEENKPAKSDNRLVIAATMKKKVVCSSIDAYLKFYDKYQYPLLFFADMPDKFRKAIIILKSFETNPNDDFVEDLNDTVSAIRHDYSLPVLMDGFLKVLDDLKSKPCVQPLIIAPVKPTEDSTDLLKPFQKPYMHPKQLASGKLSVIIPIKYYDGRERIVENAIISIHDEILRAIKFGVIKDYEIVIVRSDRESSKIELPNIKTYWVDENYNFTDSINLGLDNTDGEYLLIANDDIYAGYNSIKEMILALCDNREIGQVNPTSNCDFAWLHDIKLEIDGVQLIPNIHERSFAQKEHLIYKLSEHFNEFATKNKNFKPIAIPFCPLYFTMIRRNILEGISGHLNDSMKMIYSDKELSDRFQQAEYKTVMLPNIFVLHYGAKSRRLDELDNASKYNAVGINDALVYKKIQKFRDRKKKIVLYSGPSWEKWDASSIDKGIGGSESCQIYLGKALTHLGYDVLSFCDCNISTNEHGVAYIPYSNYREGSNYGEDVFISIRQPILPFVPRAKKTILWTHDIWYGEETSKISPSPLSKYDSCVLLSPWHKKFWDENIISRLSEPLKNVCIIPNGIDTKLFEEARAVGVKTTNPIRLIYSSSPDRGLEALLMFYEELCSSLPKQKFELHVYYGFYNLFKYAAHYNNKEFAEYGHKILDKINSMKDIGVIYHDRVPKKELAEAFTNSNFWLYPTSFHETFCITALESMLGDCIPFYCKLAALETTIPESNHHLSIDGNIIENDNFLKYKVALFETISCYINRPQDFHKIIASNRLYAESFDWNNIAMRWDSLFMELLNE